MKMKGAIMAWMMSWMGILVLTLIILGILFAVFSMNLIPGAKEWLLKLLRVG